MKHVVAYAIVLMGALLLYSCDGQKGGQAEEVQLAPNDSLFQIRMGSFRYDAILPKDLMIAHPAVISFNDITGELHIEIGSGFHLVAIQDNPDQTALKSGLADDGLFDNRVLSEDNGVILYQQFLPGDQPYYYHLVAGRFSGEEALVVRSWANGEFTRDQVERMKQAVERISLPA